MDTDPRFFEGDLSKLLSGGSLEDRITVLKRVREHLKSKAASLSKKQQELKGKAQKYLEP